MTYTHLTQDERYQIHTLKRQGISLACMAAELQRNRSTISRELKRNAGPSGYKPVAAHTCARARQCERRNALYFSAEQWNHVDAYLRLYLSPQQVSGRLKLEQAISISAESIYQRAYQDKAKGGDLVGYLRCQKVRPQTLRQRPGAPRRFEEPHRYRTAPQRGGAAQPHWGLGGRHCHWQRTQGGLGHTGGAQVALHPGSPVELASQCGGDTGGDRTAATLHKVHSKTLTFDNGKEFA